MNSFFEKQYNLIPVAALHQIWHKTGYSYLDVKRPNFGFLMLKKGSMVFHFSGASLNVKPFDVIFLSKGSNYDVSFSYPCESLLVNFDITECELSPEAPKKVFFDDSGTLCYLFEELIKIQNDKYLFNSEFYKLVHQITSIYKTQDNVLHLIENAKQLLELYPNMSICEISKNLFISRCTLSRKFIQAVGVPPGKYRVDLRLEKAKLLLVSSEIPIKEISSSLGFYDIASFCKQFKNKYSFTPSEYKRKYRILP